MPKAKPKPLAQPVAPIPPPKPPEMVVPAATTAPPMKVVYNRMEITEYSTTSAKGPLTVEDQKGLLGWETEDEYLARKLREEPGSKPDKWMANPKSKDVFGDVFHCRNVAGKKVRTNYNANNRPFDEGWCASLVHTVLHGQWAGPHTIPGETVNGETIRISKYGRVLSGQHQMTACILADEFLHQVRQREGLDVANTRFPAWARHNHCFLETIVITGMSEDPRVLMTVDYNKPRSVADVFYTSALFKDSTPTERKELCRMLAVAADTLWTRTDAKGYKTHPEVVGFLERHMRLLNCVEHLFEENNTEGKKKISMLRLSPGQCAGLGYIMSSAGPKTDGDMYRNEQPPSEKNLDWSLWDRNEDFWTLLAGGREFSPVRQALGHLVDSTPGNEDNQGLGGRNAEKLAILAKAWETFKDHADGAGPPFTEDDLADGGLLSLSYTDLDDKGNRLPDGQIKLLDVADFYGIDCPESMDGGKNKATKLAPPMPPPPTKEEIEKATEAAIERRKQAQAMIEAARKKAGKK